MTPDTADLVEIGQVLKPNGTDGFLSLSLRQIDAEEITEPVYVLVDGLPVPYFISEISRKGAGRIIARLTDIVSLEDALEISGKKLYMNRESLSDDNQDDLYGWELADASKGDKVIGTVIGIEPIPGNPLLEVDCGKKGNILVPLNEELVVEMDAESKRLVMNIPEGLTD